MPKQATGMTLVEILTALAIIAILSAIAIPTYQGYITRGQENTAKANARTLSLFMENYYEQQCDEGDCTYRTGSYTPGNSNTGFMRDLGWDPVDGNAGKDKFKYVIATCASDPISRCYKLTVKDAATDAVLYPSQTDIANGDNGERSR